MKTIRSSVFETNSSSTHSLTLSNAIDWQGIEQDGTMYLFPANYDSWGWNVLEYFYDKLQYIYTLLNLPEIEHYHSYFNEKLEVVDIRSAWERCENVLRKRLGVKEFKKTPVSANGIGSIDHQRVEDIAKFAKLTEEEFEQLLFDNNSFIVLGNDNESMPFNVYQSLPCYDPNYRVEIGNEEYFISDLEIVKDKRYSTDVNWAIYDWFHSDYREKHSSPNDYYPIFEMEREGNELLVYKVNYVYRENTAVAEKKLVDKFEIILTDLRDESRINLTNLK